MPQVWSSVPLFWRAVTQVAVAQATDFFVTASADGHIKFWKKQPQGIEFAKHYKVGRPRWWR